QHEQKKVCSEHTLSEHLTTQSQRPGARGTWTATAARWLAQLLGVGFNYVHLQSGVSCPRESPRIAAGTQPATSPTPRPRQTAGIHKAGRERKVLRAGRQGTPAGQSLTSLRPKPGWSARQAEVRKTSEAAWAA